MYSSPCSPLSFSPSTPLDNLFSDKFQSVLAWRRGVGFNIPPPTCSTALASPINNAPPQPSLSGDSPSVSLSSPPNSPSFQSPLNEAKLVQDPFDYMAGVTQDSITDQRAIRSVEIILDHALEDREQCHIEKLLARLHYELCLKVLDIRYHRLTVAHGNFEKSLVRAHNLRMIACEKGLEWIYNAVARRRNGKTNLLYEQLLRDNNLTVDTCGVDRTGSNMSCDSDPDVRPSQ